MRRLVLPLLALLLVLAGCATRSQGSPSDPVVLAHGERLPAAAPATVNDSNGLANGLTAAKALGDMATLYPCSLLDAGRLHGASFGDVGPAALDTCEATAQIDGTQDVVYVGPLVHDDVQDIGPDIGHGLRTSPPQQDSDSCEVDLEFADDTDLQVTAVTFGSGAVGDLCDFATQASKAAATLAEGGLSKSSAHIRDFSAHTFGAVDPCVLVTPPMRSTAHLEEPDTAEYPQKHECDWEAAAGAPDLDAEIYMSIDVDDLEDLQSGSTIDQISGRTTYVTSSDDDTATRCYLQTPQSPAHPGVALQVATLQVVVPIDPATPAPASACDMAKPIAATIWSALPG